MNESGRGQKQMETVSEGGSSCPAKGMIQAATDSDDDE